MGILFGLTAAFCWGTADFVVTGITRRIGVVQALVYMQLVGLLASGVLLALWSPAPAPTAAAWAITIVISIVNLAGTLLLYRAFAIGTLAIVSPIASGFAVVTALLALLAGERPSALALLGAALLIGGVIVVSRGQRGETEDAGPKTDDGRPTTEDGRQQTEDEGPKTKDGISEHRPLSIVRRPKLPPGVLEALGVTVCFGLYFWSLELVTPALGVIWPVVATRAIELVGALLMLRLRGSRPMLLLRAMLLPIVGAALLDTLAFVAFNLGAAAAYTSIVTALASLFSAVTVLLAWIIFREHLAPAQWAGVGVILFGVLLVSL